MPLCVCVCVCVTVCVRVCVCVCAHMPTHADARILQMVNISTSLLQAITEYISEGSIDLTSHELMTNFPRRNFSDMDLDMTLEDVGLHAQETIFIHKKS